MIVIPDLFGSFQKGREAAIEANWKDLQNYESIENARHQNDAAALANLATMADFGKQRRLTDNQVTNSDLNTQLNIAQMPAKLNIAEGDAMYTGMQLGTMKANEDAIKQALANQLGTFVLGAETGYNNAVVSHGRSTIGRNVFTNNFGDIYKATDGKTKADIAQTESYNRYKPLITDLLYRTEFYNGKGGLDEAKVNSEFAGPVARIRNIASESGYRLSDINSRLGILQTGAQQETFARDQLSNISSAVRALQEIQREYSKDDPRWKNIQAEIDNLRGKASDLGKFLGAGFMLNYNPVEVYAGAGTTSGGTSSSSTDTSSSSTGTTTYVDADTGRAIQVPAINIMGDPLPSLSDIVERMGSKTGNVMGVQNIGGVPNIPIAQRTSTAGRPLSNGQSVDITTPTQLPSQQQLIKNFNERRGGFL